MNNKNIYTKTFEDFSSDDLKDLYSKGKTYIQKQILKSDINDENNLFDKKNVEKGKELLKILKFYDISSFEYKDKGYGVYVYPEVTFYDYILELNYILKEPIDIRSLNFFISIDRDELNKTDFEKGIPVTLRGIGLGVKIFEFVCIKEQYLTSNKYSNVSFINMWNGLLKSKKLYCFTSNEYSGCVYKNISKYELVKIYNEVNLKIKDVVWDNEIKKIINI
jgi:hypothetical protein